MLLCGIFCGANVAEAEITAFGECGDNLTWTLYSDGELVIEGEGEMWDWQYTNYVPWCSQRDSVKTVTISEGVTTIGDRAFDHCVDLTSIVIPDSVTSIGNSAFTYCESLTSIALPNRVAAIGSLSFSTAPNS